MRVSPDGDLQEVQPAMDEKRMKIQADDDDFENCKGACGYTIWCRACMEARKEEERRRAEERRNSAEGEDPVQ